MINKHHFAADVERQRNLLNVSPNELALKAGISKSTYFRLKKKNFGDMTLNQLQDMCRYIGIRINYEVKQ